MVFTSRTKSEELDMATSGAGIGRIVVGVDGSEHSEAAIKWAVRMAKGMGSEVFAVFAIAPPVYIDGTFMAPVVPPQFDEEWRAGERRFAARDVRLVSLEGPLGALSFLL